MKRNSMRIAALLLVLVLLTTAAVGGTFAKYITTVKHTDSARIAHWGFTENETEFDLFTDVYDVAGDTATVKSHDGDDVVAPGTTKEATIQFVYGEGDLKAPAPEVAYNLTLKASLSEHDLLTETVERLRWYVKYTEEGVEKTDNYATQQELLEGIAAMVAEESEIKYTPKSTEDSGINTFGGSVEATHKYMPGKLPEWLEDGTLTIGWVWDFEAIEGENGEYEDFVDSILGNAALNAEDRIAEMMTFTISLTATQVD